MGTDDNRYLWPQMLRAIREIQPIAVVGENVTGIFNMEQHEVFARVDSRSVVRFQKFDRYEGVYTRQKTLLVNDICEDLEKEGYEVQPFVVPAASVNAPHKRDRVWFVAYSNGAVKEHHQRKKLAAKGKVRRHEKGDVLGELSGIGAAANPVSTGLQRQQFNKTPDQDGIEQQGVKEKQPPRAASQLHKNMDWDNFPTQSPFCRGNDGLPGQLHGITFSQWRKETLRGYGNAIVPQVALEFFRAIELQLKHDLKNVA